MTKLRFCLILLLSVALDFSSPVMPLGMESIEEFEEQSHRARARRAVRLTQERTGPPAPQAQRIEASRTSAVRGVPARRHVTETGVRKIPSTAADTPSSSPEDQ